MSVAELEALAKRHLARKLDMLELAAKSQLTSAQAASELAAMRAACGRAAAAWPRKEALGPVLLEKCARASCGPGEALAVLLQGAPADARDFLGRSALHWATQRGNAAVASLLMDFGAPVDAPDATNTLPLHAAASRADGVLLASLLLEQAPSAASAQNCNGWSPLHVAAFTGNESVLRLLLSSKGVDLNPGDSEGATCLHVAVAAGSLETVRLLISRGAPVNAKSHAGDTPLHYAARLGHEQLVKVLLKAGADRTQKNLAGFTCSQGMPRFAEVAAQADKEIAEHSVKDIDLPLNIAVPDSCPEARSHHFIIDEKAVEAVANTHVSFVVRTSPPRVGMRFVSTCKSNFGTSVSSGWTMDHHNGSYTITYLQPKADAAEITVALIEGGDAVAKRGFKVDTVEPRVVGRFCRAYGPGLFNPQAGTNSFSIRLRNQCGTNYDKGNVDGLSVVLQRPGNAAPVNAPLQDHGTGVYTVKFDLPASGIVSVDAQYQGQSILGFPQDLNMDRAATLASLFNVRKMDEDMAFFKQKLAAVDSSVKTGAPAARRQVQRMCVACSQREVCALLLPCRHYRYCASCASGHVVLGTPCNICEKSAEGHLVVRSDPSQ